MTLSLTGAAVGLLAGAGLALAVSRVPALRRPRLDDRLAPYLRDSARPSRLLTRERAVTPFPTLERIVGPFLVDAPGCWSGCWVVQPRPGIGSSRRVAA